MKDVRLMIVVYGMEGQRLRMRRVSKMRNMLCINPLEITRPEFLARNPRAV